MPVHVTDIPCDCSLPYCTGLSHTHICVSEQPLWLTDRADFETLLNIKQQRFWMTLKDEVRAEFCQNLCMHGFQAIQTVGTFSFFCSNVLSCNNSKTMCFMLAQRVFCRPPESVCRDSQIWDRLKRNAEQHQNVGSQKYVQTLLWFVWVSPVGQELRVF